MIVVTPVRVLLETLRLNTDVYMVEELRKIAVPTLIVHGDQDASASLELTGLKPTALIDRAVLIVYEGAGHGLYASDHEALNADLLAFIKDRSL
jgi:non-heme chloroperoxidase